MNIDQRIRRVLTCIKHNIEIDATDIQILIKELKTAQSDLYEANNIINDLLDIVKQKDKLINEILRTWKQDDVRSIEELREYFEKKVQE